MPIGILIDSAAILSGGIIGAALGKRMPERFIKTLSVVFALSAIMIGISMIPSVSQLSAVILALIIGAAIGEGLSLNARVASLSNRLNAFCQKRFHAQRADIGTFINIIIMLSISGYGIFGALNEGFAGNHAPLLVKALLDFFTILCFATSLGKILICAFIPQFTVYILIFFSSTLIMPFITTAVMGDLSACAGVITLATGLNLLFDREIPTVSMLPSLILVVPISLLWANIK